MATKFKNVPFGTEVPTIVTGPDGSGIIDLSNFSIDNMTGIWGIPVFHCGLTCCGGDIVVQDGNFVMKNGGISVTGSTGSANAIIVSGGGDIMVRDGGAFRNDCGTTFIGAEGDRGTIVRSSSFAVREYGCAYMFSVASNRAEFTVPVEMNNPMLTCSTFYLIARLSCGCTFYADCGSSFCVDCGSSFCVNCGSSFCVNCGSSFCGDLTGSITFGCGHSVGGSHSVDFYYPPVFHCGSSLFCCGTIGFASEDNTRSCFLAVYGDGSSITQDGFGDPSNAVAAFSMSSGDGLVIESRYGGMKLKSSCGSLSITVGSTTLELDENALKTLKTNIGA